MKSMNVIEVEDSRVGCDGGGGSLGHPLVYLTMDEENRAECPYCGQVFVLKEGAKAAAH